MHPVLAAALGLTVAGASDPGVRAVDIVDGYRQNFAEFRTLHVQWQRISINAENFVKNLQVVAADLEAQSARAGTPEERAQLLSQSQAYQQMAANPRITTPNVYKQDFWTDKVGFQMRLASPKLAERRAEWNYPPAVPRLDTDALLRDYKETAVICFDGKVENGFRIWNGKHRGDQHVASILNSPPDSEATNFPVLGLMVNEWGANWHPFDEVFAAPIEQLHVLREEQMDGSRTYVIERMSENPHKQLRLTPEHLKKFGDRVQTFETVRAWVDPSKGYIPLRMEWSAFSLYDGRRLNSPIRKPFSRVIEDVDVRPVAGTSGYYPVRSVMRSYAVEAGYRGEFVTLGDVIEGKTPANIPARLHREWRWEVSTVEANRDMSGLLSLEFPDRTAYFDARQSRSFITGNAGKVFDDALAKQDQRVTPPPTARWNVFPILTLAALVGAAVMLVSVMIRRFRAV